jgi:hypothetical protein
MFASLQESLGLGGVAPNASGVAPPQMGINTAPSTYMGNSFALVQVVQASTIQALEQWIKALNVKFAQLSTSATPPRSSLVEPVFLVFEISFLTSRHNYLHLISDALTTQPSCLNGFKGTLERTP